MTKFAKKSLGQNFLTSTTVRDDILELLPPHQCQNVLEIGPGLGFLTHQLVKKAEHLKAVELDPRAAKQLRADLEKWKHFELIEADFLKTDLDSIFDQKKYSVVGNIPYNITSPILKKCLADTKNKPQVMIIMVQKEVAEKICIDPFKKKPRRSILGLSVEIFAESEYAFTVDRSFFQPIPGVDSAVMRLTLRDKPLIPPSLEKAFFTIVQAGFAERRKKLSNSLARFFGENMDHICEKADLEKRAEALEVEDWKKMAEKWLKSKQEKTKPNLPTSPHK
ncbi:MAG TPA: 16S rRNA (adenine(1518)-N(6)/adenine(1519)-N(6))-dimethyltransferase RsmA [Candidatus Gracilibacteria bacterium]